MTNNIIDKHTRIANFALLTGISTVLIPSLSGLGGAFFIIYLGHPLLPIPIGLYLTKALYYLSLSSVLIFCAIGLIKPCWNIQVVKLFIAMTCTAFSLYHFNILLY